MTIAKVCEIMTWQDQNIGILDKNGFNIDLTINENFLGQCITLKERDLDFDVDLIKEMNALEAGE